MTCKVCNGTGWMTYPHPDDNGGLNGTAVSSCPECVDNDICPACGKGTFDYGTLHVCVFCGFTFDFAAEPIPGTAELRK